MITPDIFKPIQIIAFLFIGVFILFLFEFLYDQEIEKYENQRSDDNVHSADQKQDLSRNES